MTSDYTDTVIEEWQTVRPDLDTSTAAVVNRVLRLARRFESDLDRAVARFGLGRKGDFDTLAALRRANRPAALSPTELAASAMITTGGMTARLDRLEQAGWIERRPDPGDRRGIRVHLTDPGRALVDEVQASNLAQQRRLLAALSDGQREKLAGLLRRLLLELGDV